MFTMKRYTILWSVVCMLALSGCLGDTDPTINKPQSSPAVTLDSTEPSPSPSVYPSPTTPLPSESPKETPTPTPSPTTNAPDVRGTSLNEIKTTSNITELTNGVISSDQSNIINNYILESLSNSALLSGSWTTEAPSINSLLNSMDHKFNPQLVNKLTKLSEDPLVEQRLIQSLAFVFTDNEESRIQTYCEPEILLSCLDSSVIISFISIRLYDAENNEIGQNITPSVETPPATPVKAIIEATGNTTRKLYKKETNKPFTLSALYSYEIGLDLQSNTIISINNSYEIDTRSS